MSSIPLLGLLANPSASADVLAIMQGSRDCLTVAYRFYIPEVIDYESRRELLRAGKTSGIDTLDRLKAIFAYLPITTPAMLRVADLWAQSRLIGIATGDPKKLDIDVILAAQAKTLPVLPVELTVVISNVSHLSRFVPADLWTNINP